MTSPAKYNVIMQKCEKSSKNNNYNQTFSKLNGSIFLKFLAKLYLLPTIMLLKFVMKSYRNFLKIKTFKQIQSQILIRAYVKAPWKHTNFNCV